MPCEPNPRPWKESNGGCDECVVDAKGNWVMCMSVKSNRALVLSTVNALHDADLRPNEVEPLMDAALAVLRVAIVPGLSSEDLPKALKQLHRAVNRTVREGHNGE